MCVCLTKNKKSQHQKCIRFVTIPWPCFFKTFSTLLGALYLYFRSSPPLFLWQSERTFGNPETSELVVCFFIYEQNVVLSCANRRGKICFCLPLVSWITWHLYARIKKYEGNKHTTYMRARAHKQTNKGSGWVRQAQTDLLVHLRLILHRSVYICFVLHELAAFLSDNARFAQFNIDKEVTVINNLRTVLELKNHYFTSLIFYYQFCPHRCHCHHWFWVLL